MRKRTVKWFIIAGLLTLLLSGCSLVQTTPDNEAIDPPPDDQWVEDVMGDSLTMTEGEEEEGDTAPVTLYFKDAYDNVAPVTMNIPMTTGIAQRALEYMIDGSTSSAELPTGFTPLIPAGTTASIDIKEDEKLAVVDFSREFASYDVADERKIVEAITWMLTGFPTIDKVKLSVNGEPLQAMPVGGLPLQEPLTRAIGINLEPFEGVNLAAAQPVTLYFKSETPDAFDYLVPVTRMIDNRENKAEAVLQELIAGPEEDGLYAVLAPEVEVLDLQSNEDLITVDFNDYVLDPEFRILEDSMQSVILSLTENNLAEQVQIMVNGDVEVMSSSDQSLTQPVTRPDHFNIYNL